MLLFFAALIGLIHHSNSKCYSMMGISTCEGKSQVDQKYPFSVPWWVANVNARTPHIRVCVNLARESAVWKIVEKIPYVNDMMDMALGGTVFEDTFSKANEYFASKGEVVELLVDKTLTYEDIYLSFKPHQTEIIDTVDEVMNAGVYDENVMAFFRAYKNILKKGAMIITMIPPFVFDPYLNLFDSLKLDSEEKPTVPPLEGTAFMIVNMVADNLSRSGAQRIAKIYQQS